MPQGQMLITLKGIAETLLSLLTLLLQVMMHQIETNPALESEEESPHQSETQAMMNMMQELQSQRNLVQEMMNQQSRASRSKAASGPPTGRLSLPPEGTTRRGLAMNRPSVETTSQQSWSVLEEEEILLEEPWWKKPSRTSTGGVPAPRSPPVMALPASSTTNPTSIQWWLLEQAWFLQCRHRPSTWKSGVVVWSPGEGSIEDRLSSTFEFTTQAMWHGAWLDSEHCLQISKISVDTASWWNPTTAEDGHSFLHR